MITDGIDAALIRLERSERTARATTDAVDALLVGEFHPFDHKNFGEALGELDESTAIKVCACLQAENYALAGSLIADHCIDYWTNRAEKYLEKEAEKDAREFEADSAFWRAAA